MQPLDLCVNRKLKCYLKANNEVYQLKSDILNDVVNFCNVDKSAKNGWRRIGLYSPTLKCIEEVKYDCYFLSEKEYSLPRNKGGNKKEINVKDCINKV